MNNLKVTRKIIFCLMFLMMFSFIAGQGINEYYKIDLNYNYGEFELINLDVEISNEIIENYFGFYLVKVIDSENESLNLSFFAVPNEILYDEVDENGTIVSGGLLILNETNFTIYVPYYKNANEIIIYNENLTEKLKIGVGMFSKVSGEELEKGVLEGEEPELTEEKEAETFTEKLAKKWWIFGIILLVLVIILIRSFVKKSK